MFGNLQIGIVYPQTEFGNDPSAIRDYAQTAESLGYTHILAYDHVVGANPHRPGGWFGPYTSETPFQEPLVLFSFLAAITQKIKLTTGIIILPQRQTTLVAKQTATLDVLSSGRLRLGVGIGWNAVEYEALNENFKNRGQRLEEQIEILRLLWTNHTVTFQGKWHSIPDAGINPRPVQRPIPIWFGGHAEEAVQRAARLGDGWMPNFYTPEEAAGTLDLIKRTLDENGRDYSSFGLEARLKYEQGNPANWEPWINGWQKAGATHICLNTMGHGFTHPREHLQAITRFASWAGLNNKE
jgi:probable F420-dependent oxidoreductase